jgi:hypothetical protein
MVSREGERASLRWSRWQTGQGRVAAMVSSGLGCRSDFEATRPARLLAARWRARTPDFPMGLYLKFLRPLTMPGTKKIWRVNRRSPLRKKCRHRWHADRRRRISAGGLPSTVRKTAKQCPALTQPRPLMRLAAIGWRGSGCLSKRVRRTRQGQWRGIARAQTGAIAA